MSVFEKQMRIIVDVLGVDPSKVTTDARLVADLGADSLDGVEIIMWAEEEFGVDMDNEAYWPLSEQDLPISAYEAAIVKAMTAAGEDA